MATVRPDHFAPVTSEGAMAADDAVARRGMVTIIWMGVGIVSLLFAAYCFYGWISSGHFWPPDIGKDEPTTGEKAFTIFSYVVGVTGWVYVYAKYVVGPWRATGQISSDGILVLALQAMWFPYDLFINSMMPTFIYSSWGLNFGGWMADVPTTIAPNGENMPASFAGMVAYPWSIFLPAALGSDWIRKRQAKNPQQSYLTHFGLLWFILFLFGFQELPTVYFKMMSFQAAVGSLTLFPGEYYQLPLYETFFYSLMMVIIAAFRHFRDEKGLSIVERSVDHIAKTPRQRFAYRFLATHGFAVTVFLLAYNIPEALVSLHSDTYPRDLPSFLSNDVCGTPASNGVPCVNGSDMPLPRAGSR